MTAPESSELTLPTQSGPLGWHVGRLKAVVPSEHVRRLMPIFWGRACKLALPLCFWHG